MAGNFYNFSIDVPPFLNWLVLQGFHFRVNQRLIAAAVWQSTASFQTLRRELHMVSFDWLNLFALLRLIAGPPHAI
jgi:hypothetical protein